MSSRRIAAALVSIAGAVLLACVFIFFLGKNSTGSEKKPVNDIVPPVDKKMVQPKPLPRPAKPAASEESKPEESKLEEPDQPVLTDPIPAENTVPDSPAEEPSGRWFLLEQSQYETSAPLRSELDVPVFKKRLPNGFGALELSDEQKAEIYRIQEDYHRVLTPLYMRADRLRAERDEQIKAVLTDDQRQQFAERKKK